MVFVCVRDFQQPLFKRCFQNVGADTKKIINAWAVAIDSRCFGVLVLISCEWHPIHSHLAPISTSKGILTCRVMGFCMVKCKVFCNLVQYFQRIWTRLNNVSPGKSNVFFGSPSKMAPPSTSKQFPLRRTINVLIQDIDDGAKCGIYLRKFSGWRSKFDQVYIDMYRLSKNWSI